MAILMNCCGCRQSFCTSASGASYCDDCNGNNEAKRKEKERWSKLGDSEKIEELLARVESLEKHECNPLIG